MEVHKGVRRVILFSFHFLLFLVRLLETFGRSNFTYSVLASFIICVLRFDLLRLLTISRVAHELNLDWINFHAFYGIEYVQEFVGLAGAHIIIFVLTFLIAACISIIAVLLVLVTS